MTPARIAEIRARLEAEADDESGSVKEQQARKDRADLLASHDALQAEVERLDKLVDRWRREALFEARTDAAQRMRERCAKSFEDKATSLRQMFNNAYGSMWPFGHEAIVRSREDDAAAIRAIPLEES